MLKADPEVVAILPPSELESLFDYQYYLRHVDDIFERLGLTKTQWQSSIIEPTNLAPRAL